MVRLCPSLLSCQGWERTLFKGIINAHLCQMFSRIKKVLNFLSGHCRRRYGLAEGGPPKRGCSRKLLPFNKNC